MVVNCRIVGYINYYLMNFRELLNKVEEALANITEKVADVAGDVKDRAFDVTGKATNVVVNVADDMKDAFLDFTNLRSVRERLVDTMLEATKDGHLSAEELAEFKRLQNKLQISDVEMNDIKFAVLREVINHAMADGKVTADEMRLIDELQKDLEIPSESLKVELDKVKAMFTA